MAPQPSLFKVFSVGQITSIKCCPLAAHRSAAADAEGKREKKRGEGTKTESRRDRRVWPRFSRRSLTHSHAQSLADRPTLSQYNNTWAG